jgi:hypothetical protein
MRRWVARAMAVVSLVLCLAAVWAGVRSFTRKDKLEWVSEGRRLMLLISRAGRVDVLYNGAWTGEPGFTHVRGAADSIGATDTNRRYLGFGVGSQPGGTWWVNVPWWFLAMGLAAGPAWMGWVVVRRRGRLVTGVCTGCGYDLRATPGRCPECGREV